ncbi:hypothetical protein B0T25DRAFT_474680 [Lasiosphaeria hispida]|uniref:Zn(2)-C6 fungal-type domain-containing protein n=1 Tax=Lasiosphaeria hispida TaxID=260671 RepID=A0AAJ0HL73_9PEZI|nr:hypothetical protein B0T25DRAFT_474680 [Lasiosphaeria hispida]
MEKTTNFTVSPLKRRACVACTTAKSKCSPHFTSQTVCERCSRLGKQCVFLDLPERRRRPQSARQVEALADKVDRLSTEIAILKHQNNKPGSASLPGAPITAVGDANGAVSSTVLQPVNAIPAAPDLDTRFGYPLNHEGPDIVDRGWITVDDAEYLIATFKETFVPRFPFVTLGSNECAAYLRKHSPFLFLCIVAVPLYTNPLLQQRLGEEIRRQVSLRLIFNTERSMDLLRGLLVYSAWYHHFAHQGHGQLFMLSQLSVTVAYDLGLPEGYINKAGVIDDNGKRAVLGVFWLAVIVSRVLQKPIGMRHIKVIDDWSLGFAVGPERATDTAIQPMMLLQSFAYRFIETFPSAIKVGDVHSEESRLSIHATSPFLLQLENLKEKIKGDGAGLAIPNYIELEVLHLEGWLLETTLAASRVYPETAFAIPGTITSGPVLDETQFLWRKIRKNQLVLQHLLQMPLEEMCCMPFIIYSWLCGSLTLLERAVWGLLREIMDRDDGSGAAQDAGWKISEAQIVIDEVKYLTTTDALSKKFETAYGNLKDGVDDGSELGRLLHHIRMLRRSYHRQVQKITGASIVETKTPGHELTSQLTQIWGGNSELAPPDFDVGGDDLDVGVWTSMNDFLFL